jgi:hypothetical protein
MAAIKVSDLRGASTKGPVSQSAKTTFQEIKKDLNNITSWELVPSSFSEGLKLKFTEDGSLEQINLFLKILKS